jgi:hypothetical protein
MTWALCIAAWWVLSVPVACLAVRLLDDDEIGPDMGGSAAGGSGNLCDDQHLSLQRPLLTGSLQRQRASLLEAAE